uniref:Uncharacterized protein n=1 Tax=Haemonchus contortus TaxID=6289 RepID=A0A7I4Y1E5_HAECO
MDDGALTIPAACPISLGPKLPFSPLLAKIKDESKLELLLGLTSPNDFDNDNDNDKDNGDNFEVKCTILAQETEISARKALEAFWIFKRNPKMNGRDECPSITNDLLPYIPHCDL